MILIILGDGVVANVLLNRSKGKTRADRYCGGLGSGRCIPSPLARERRSFNPAVTMGLAAIGKFSWSEVPRYVAAQMIGAFLGAVIVWLAYLPHWKETSDTGAKLGVFCTAPAIRQSPANLLTEIIGTFILVLGALAIPSPKNLNVELGFSAGLGPLLVGLLVLSMASSWADRPVARSIQPVILDRASPILSLPIPGKGTRTGYAWIPIVGPLVGGTLGALFTNFWTA
jgi:glycerol uptake facilitator protein